MITIIHESSILRTIIQEWLREYDPDYPVEDILVKLPETFHIAVEQMLAELFGIHTAPSCGVDASKHARRIRRKDNIIRNIVISKLWRVDSVQLLMADGTLRIQLV